MRRNKYESILKAASLLAGVQGLNVFLNIIRTKIVAVLLGTTGVGLNGIYNETRELLHSSTNLGLDVSGVRGISQAYEKLKALEKKNEDGITEAIAALADEVTLLRSWVLLLALLGMFLCMVCASPLSLFTFGNYEHTWGYVLLSPAVAFSTITCGELAVLKGLRKLKSLAKVSVINVILGLLVSVPIYYVWGISGVLAAIVILAAATMLNAILFGYRAYKPAFTFSRKRLSKGSVMLSVGTVFVVCGMFGHLVQLFIQSYLNKEASTEMVGLYNASCTITTSCIGMLFAVMDQDYFPRLTGVIKDKVMRMETVRNQLELTTMLASPLLIAFVVFLPVIVPLLLTSEFTPVVVMAQASCIGLMCRMVYLSHAYLPLAAGDKWVYFLINIVGAFDLLLVIVGYNYAGLLGMGICLSVQHAIDLLIVIFISRYKYDVVLDKKLILTTLCHFTLLIVTYAACFALEGWKYWVVGCLMILSSSLFSCNRYQAGK